MISALEIRSLDLLLKRIFKNLPIADILSCLCVNKSWYRIVHENALKTRTSYEELEAMWSYDKLNATKLDYHDRLDEESLDDDVEVKVLSDFGHIAILPKLPQLKRYKTDQPMFVYRGSKFAAKTTMPLYDVVKETIVHQWEWKFVAVAVAEDGQLVLVGITDRKCQDCSKFYGSLW